MADSQVDERLLSVRTTDGTLFPSYVPLHQALLLEPHDANMNTQTDVDPKLDDVLLFNDYLLKLADAGVQISLDGTGSNQELLEKLSQINSRFAMGIARGNTVPGILETEPLIPNAYRAALLTWLYCGHSPDALNALSESANGHVRRERLLRSSILQPLILVVMAYFGFLLWLIFIGPKMKSIALQIGATPGIGLKFLEFASQTMWLWAISFPILICLGLVFWLRMRSSGNLLWLPGRRGIDDSIQVANYATGIANLLQHDFSDGQAKNAIGPSAFHSSKSTPLLNWALGEDVATEERSNALFATAQAYRGLAKWRTARLEYWFPVVIGALFGGVVVLAYGLSLFEPLIELLTSLTQVLPGGNN